MLNRYDRIITLAQAIATDLFISMLNPKLRGSGFNYKEFDISRHVKAMIGTNFAKPLSDKEKQSAGEAGRLIWNRWIETAGEGLPKP